MYTYFYVCTWCNVHMCTVSASVIHIWIWGKISDILCMYMLCVCICVTHSCMWRPVQDIGFFFLYCFLLVVLWQHLSLNLKVNISAGLVGSTCSTPTHSQSWDTCTCSHAQLFVWLLPLSLHRKHFPSETSPFLHMFVLSSMPSKEQINSLIVAHKHFDTGTEA